MALVMKPWFRLALVAFLVAAAVLIFFPASEENAAASEAARTSRLPARTEGSPDTISSNEKQLTEARREARSEEPELISPTESITEEPALIYMGRVVDDLSHPIPGAEIRSLSFENMLRVNSGLSKLEEPIVLTDDDGRFRIKPLDGTESALQVRAAGYATRLLGAPREGWPDAPTYGDIVLQTGVTLSGSVRGSDDEPIAGARIVPVAMAGHAGVKLPFDRDAPHALAHTSATGVFTLEGVALGPWSIRCLHPHYRAGSASGTAAAGANAPIEIVLGAGASITGRVRGIPRDAGDLSISCRPVTQQDDVFGRGYDKGGKRHQVAPDGTFEVHGLSPGASLWLDAWTGAYSTHMSERRSTRVTASSGDRGVLLDYAAGIDVTFVVKSAADGEPVEDIYAVCVEFDRSYTEIQAPGAKDGVGRWPGGRVTVRGVVQALESQPLHVVVFPGGPFKMFERDFENVASEGRVDLGVLELEPNEPTVPSKTVAHVRVVRGDGTPRPDAVVEWRTPGSNGGAQRRTDDAGQVDIRSMPSEEIEVALGRNYRRSFGQEGVHPGISPSADDREWVRFLGDPESPKDITLTLDQSGALEVIVTRDGAPDPDAEVALYGFGRSIDQGIPGAMSGDDWIECDARGRARFAEVGIGEWILVVRGSDGARHVEPVRVESHRQSVRVSLGGGVLEGRVVTPAGEPVSGAIVGLGRASRPFADDYDRIHRSTYGTAERTTAELARGWRRTTTDEDGHYAFQASIDGAQFIVHATARGMTTDRSEPLALGSEDQTVPDLVLREAGTVALTLAPEWEGAIGIVAPAGLDVEQSFQQGRAIHFRDGQDTMGGLAPGPIRILILLKSAVGRGDAIEFHADVMAGEIVEVDLGPEQVVRD